ncbi:MAG TPA: CAP domain-containing protein [Burkholderiaceae bacterium]|nr:CAP domain-containing protein [Burkholderiaceae bacterium]
MAASPSERRRRHALALVAGALLATGSLAPDSARSDTAKPTCGARLSPDEVVQRLNAMRARGLVCRQTAHAGIGTPLRWSANLTAVAAAQSNDMAALNHMSHRDSQNRSLTERLAAMGYRFSAAAENVAYGYDSLDAVVQAWVESEGHCENLMNAKVAEFGLACSDSDAARFPGEARYWTLVLGAPPRAR